MIDVIVPFFNLMKNILVRYEVIKELKKIEKLNRKIEKLTLCFYMNNIIRLVAVFT